MELVVIAAVSLPDKIIGYQNKLPWNVPEDMRRFRALTTGEHVIMGRKTFESLDNPLRDRYVHVITRNEAYNAGEAMTHPSLEDALLRVQNENTVYIAGGEKIYEQSLDIADRLELTWVYGKFPGDTFFPPVDWSRWDQDRWVERDGYAFASYVPTLPFAARNR